MTAADKDVKHKVGYTPEELQATEPEEGPPEPGEAQAKAAENKAQAERPTAGQKVHLSLGFIIIATGLIAWPLTSIKVGLAVVLAGALFIIVGTFMKM